MFFFTAKCFANCTKDCTKDFREPFKLRLHTAINRADFHILVHIITKCIREKMTLTFVGEPLNHIHQDTKIGLINRSV